MLNETKAEIRNLAENDYMLGMKYEEIAKKYEVSLNTIKSWKKRYGWNRKTAAGLAEKKGSKTHKEVKKCLHTKTHTKSEKVCTQNDGTKECKNVEMAGVARDTEESAELSDKQRLFCIYYVRCFNATKAYQKAYGCSYETAAAVSYRMLENVGVKNEIEKLRRERFNREYISEHDIFQRYIDIAFADITDFVEFGREKVPVMGAFGPIKKKDETTGKEVELQQEVNVVRFRESAIVDGTLITEVKQGRNGASIKLADRMKALQWLTEHLDMATEEQRARIALLKAKINDPSEDGAADDGFLEALEGTAKEDWADGADISV